MLRSVCLFLLLFMGMPEADAGEAYRYSGHNSVVGFLRTYRIVGDESLYEMARRFDLGFNEMAGANPRIDPWLPGDRRRVIVPTKWVLPNAPYKGIVINLAEMRLYHYITLKGRRHVKTYPIGVGVDGFNSPTGKYKISRKVINPAWYVPMSLREERPDLPRVVPPGEENPLGSHAMRLSGSNYLIHGTNKPYGVGMKVSHGCIRLYPEDIPLLFASVKRGTPVNIIYQPIKTGMREGTVYVEVHEDYLGIIKSPLGEAIRLLKAEKLLDRVDREQLRLAVAAKKGIPIPLKKR